MEKAKSVGWMKILMAIFMIGYVIAPPFADLAKAADIPWQGLPGGNIYTPPNTQNVGIGTETPRAKLQISNGSLLVEGDQGTIGGLETLGMGSRLMWIPSLAAFRVGMVNVDGCSIVNGAQLCAWDSPNIGFDSIGIGSNTNASGESSIAIGYNSISNDVAALSIGLEAKATNFATVAIGLSAEANGMFSTSIGYNNKANATQSIVIGSDTNNSFGNSLMIGFNSTTHLPMLFADRTGVILNGVPQQGAPRYTMAVNGNASINGNLLLGVTAAQAGTHRIAVRGSIKAEEIVVATTWADYVFNEDYALPPLSEVAAYIKKNKRLPEIPAGAQIEREGLKMADMIALQMKKIEELTLYAIELKKENEALKAELQANGRDLNERLQVLEAALVKATVR